jgi:hypothetical protein
MLNLINHWKNTTLDREEQALLALRFVQDEVRYLSLNNGFRPSDPNRTFQQRLGDCKDKTVLLQTLLQLLGISSHPVMVCKSSEEKTALDLLPTMSYLFPHVILKIDIGDSSFWVDPTRSLQGGKTLAENRLPDLGWGLVLAEETEGLIQLPHSPFLTPTTVSTDIKLLSPETAEATTTITSYGLKAEMVRHRLKQLGSQKFSQEYLDASPQNSKLSSPFNICDDRENNIFKLSFTYQFPTKGRPDKKKLPIDSKLLNDGLDAGPNASRTTPYALHYPLWVKEHIHIENPFTTWQEESDELSEELSSLSYKSSFKIGKHTADYDFELRHLQDHIPVEEIQSYVDLMQRIEFPEPLKVN